MEHDDTHPTDEQMIDYLEELMRPATGYVEVYLAGRRNGRPDWSARSFQVELQNKTPEVGSTLREAIAAAMKKYPIAEEKT
jgi:hypothetical protein